MKIAPFAALAAFAVAPAAFGQVILSDSASITEDGQTFVFDFGGVALSDGSDGTLVVEALGDFSATPPSSEVLDIDIDGIFTDFAFDPSRGAVIGSDLFQNAATQTFTVSGSDLVAITSDGMVTITLDAAGSVGFFADQPEDFVMATLTFSAIPEPASAGILGLAGLTLLRRRR
jgi:hypothetical protein